MKNFKNTFDKLLEMNSYSLTKKVKNKFLLKEMNDLNNHHNKNCPPYKKIMSLYNTSKIKRIDEMPMIPSRLFKSFNLKSTNSKIVKVMSSSGTSGNSSKINLDSKNALNQTLVLKKLFYDNFGKNRYPMLIIDQNPKYKQKFDASVAAILGFSIFGKNHTYAIDPSGNLDIRKIKKFYVDNKNKTKFIFGFTSKIYEYLLNNLDNKLFKINMSKDFLLHGGGWKKLEKKKITNKVFKNKLYRKFKLSRIINYYGMVEQTGSIFFECEKKGYFHTSNFSDIYIRNKYLEVCKKNETGIVQLLSILPRSYPGHNLLTEDLGMILGEDNCPCGKKGKYFKIIGRVKNAELRGCSDVA